MNPRGERVKIAGEDISERLLFGGIHRGRRRRRGCEILAGPFQMGGLVMFRRVAFGGVLVVLLSFCGPPAQARPVRPLSLSSYTMSVISPNATASICDQGSWLNCGYVQVAAQFAGLEGRERPADPGAPSGNLSGTVHVSRIYGCQKGTKRLTGYDRRVNEDVYLNTRRGLGFSTPASGNILTVTVYAFLLDAQPRNCPKDTQAMTYEIKAAGVELQLQSVSAPFPSAHYSAPGMARWCGAVPTPIATS
jgi:hypothetical protein